MNKIKLQISVQVISWENYDNVYNVPDDFDTDDLKEKEWSEDEPENSDELMLHSEWCIYTRKNDFIPDCSFYQTKHEHETLLAKQPEVVQAVQVNDDYQDMDRTYMTNERALDQRLDCSTKQEGVLQ